jgi:pimeloyl-ACP methyl ester carboxylesterase
MRPTPLVVAGLAVALLFGARAASAFISANTIDGLATYTQDGRLVRVTGPIACTRGERIAIRAAIRQPATAALARGRWNGRCTGEVQHWQVRARARGGSRFENGRGRVCAVARTRRGARVTDRRRWCERVQVAATFGRGKATVAQDVCFTDSELRRIDVPTALLWGRHDRFVRSPWPDGASARLGTANAGE